MALKTSEGRVMQGGHPCACGCSARYASYHRNGKYYISIGHYKNMKAAEEAKIAAAAADAEAQKG